MKGLDDTLIKKSYETQETYIKRIVAEKLINKTIDTDFVELAPLLFGQELSSTECRKRMYGIKRLLEVSDGDASLATVNYEKNGYEQTKSYKETIEINKDGSYTSDKLIGIEDESQLKDEAFLLSVHNYDPKVWQIVTARNSIWNAQRKGGDIIKMYASKITVKPRTNSIAMQEIEEHFKKFSETYIPMPKIYTTDLVLSDKMLEVPVVDLHFGKKAYSFEVGESVDSEIIEKRFLSVIDDIINRVEGQKFQKVIFPIGNDFFNSDTIENTTTRGTRQDNDLRWQEMFLKGVELLIKAIDKLSVVAPVEVFYVAGNHDKMASYYATHYLNAWYRRDDRVQVSIDPQIRKYIEFGNCLIGFSHGNEEGKRISNLMQIEVSNAWGRTKFREWHLGHLHHENSKEENGVVVRGLSTITGTDAWHYESGYVGAVKKQQAFVWDKNKGLTDIIISTIIE